jgi:hypothetical protein
MLRSARQGSDGAGRDLDLLARANATENASRALVRTARRCALLRVVLLVYVLGRLLYRRTSAAAR